MGPRTESQMEYSTDLLSETDVLNKLCGCFCEVCLQAYKFTNGNLCCDNPLSSSFSFFASLCGGHDANVLKNDELLE